MVDNTSKWGKATAAKRYAEGGGVRPLPITPSAGGMGPPKPDDFGSRMASARTSGSREVVERESNDMYKKMYGKSRGE
jgi:hypothetical protein